MKKTLVFSLLSMLLFSGTALRELVKLPVLFQHYFEHKELDSGITFISYLNDHYNSTPHTDNDEARDKELPFKSNQFAGLYSPAVTSCYAGRLRKPFFTGLKQQQGIYQENFKPKQSAGKIWQPPKPGSTHFV